MDRKKSILLTAYLNQNLGDDLFINIITNKYKDYDFIICSDYRRLLIKSEMLLKHDYIYYISERLHSYLNRRGCEPNILKKFYKKQICRLVNKAACCVNIIGSGFIEKKNSFDNIEFQNAFYCDKTCVIGSNFGPYLTKEFYSKYYNIFSRIADVCFRESYSANLFSNLELRCECDVVFGYDLGEVLPKRYRDSDYVVISIIDVTKHFADSSVIQSYFDFLTRSIVYWHNRGKRIVIAVFCKREGDYNAATKLKNIILNLRADINIDICCYPDYSCKEMMGIVKNSSFVVASRFHAAIIGLLYKKIIYPIPYSDKMIHVLADLFPDKSFPQLEDVVKLDPETYYSSYFAQLTNTQLQTCINSAKRQFLGMDKILKSSL